MKRRKIFSEKFRRHVIDTEYIIRTNRIINLTVKPIMLVVIGFEDMGNFSIQAAPVSRGKLLCARLQLRLKAQSKGCDVSGRLPGIF